MAKKFAYESSTHNLDDESLRQARLWCPSFTARFLCRTVMVSRGNISVQGKRSNLGSKHNEVSIKATTKREPVSKYINSESEVGVFTSDRLYPLRRCGVGKEANSSVNGEAEVGGSGTADVYGAARRGEVCGWLGEEEALAELHCLATF
ncbi:hypothetical protein J6590_043809 [Homalodisca vitripennis]|nr:hypothetical protein J6590_043809 [Homalodisca vitripennis]